MNGVIIGILIIIICLILAGWAIGHFRSRPSV
jgi:hypothetical protein